MRCLGPGADHRTGRHVGDMEAAIRWPWDDAPSSRDPAWCQEASAAPSGGRTEIRLRSPISMPKAADRSPTTPDECRVGPWLSPGGCSRPDVVARDHFDDAGARPAVERARGPWRPSTACRPGPGRPSWADPPPGNRREAHWPTSGGAAVRSQATWRVPKRRRQARVCGEVRWPGTGRSRRSRTRTRAPGRSSPQPGRERSRRAHARWPEAPTSPIFANDLGGPIGWTVSR